MDYKEKIKSFVFNIDNLLTEYILVHDKLVKESGFFSLFKKIDFAELYRSTAPLFQKSISGLSEIEEFKSKFYEELSEKQKLFLDSLIEYTLALTETIQCLLKLTYDLAEKSKGSQGKKVTWDQHKANSDSYKDARNKYLVVGKDLNSLYRDFESEELQSSNLFQKKEFDPLGLKLDQKNFPVLYRSWKHDPVWLEKRLRALADAVYQGDVASAAQALESDLEHSQ